jgi:hypothetical protein
MMCQEGHLASRALLAGFEAVRRLDYDRPATVYEALFNLAVGFERFLKIIAILNYRSNNDLKFPDIDHLKDFGHSIDTLYEHCKVQGQKKGISSWPVEIYKIKILYALGEFARSSRYFNLNELSGDSRGADPLVQWFEVHFLLAQESVPGHRRQSIMEESRAFCERANRLGWEWGPRGQLDLSIDVTYQIELTRVATGYLVWAMIQLIKPQYQLLDALVCDLQERELASGATDTVPTMTEFFPFGLTMRDAAVRRKQWTKLFDIGGRV